MNELIPIGFIPPVQPKEVNDALPEIERQVDALLDLTPAQRKQVREIAIAHVKNNQGRLPNIPGIANHVKTNSL